MCRPTPVIVLALVLGTAASARAVPITLITQNGLSGGQEVPPPVRVTDGSGDGIAILDLDLNTLEVQLSWADLTAPAGAAHIHCCSGPGANSTVAIDFVPFGFPSAIAGTFSHVFDLTDPASYGGGFLSGVGGDVDAARDAVAAGLLGSLAYFNIHTETYPGGEIRGDLTPAPSAVPEPATLVLTGVGLAAGLLRRRTPRGQ